MPEDDDAAGHPPCGGEAGITPDDEAGNPPCGGEAVIEPEDDADIPPCGGDALEATIGGSPRSIMSSGVRRITFA